ncbi:HelD family protein [Loigolactobacillus jiayinensis]|uniref:HelD family protein n=1 Tax=Loigolactobacillus jiayinensis TaxID=2486016 RepID=A0ABW1RL17_9LACO|nr:UvrD-helicase domain-containing protein [Loigolactobacillus jiayinensis]
MTTVFEHEQAYLKQTYQQLLHKQTQLQAQQTATQTKALAAKSNLGSDITLNFDTDIKTMETLADIESRNREIDTYNFDRDIAATTLAQLKLLLEQPYFAKVQLQFAPTEAPENFYIGTVGMTDENKAQMIIDWRSPIAETYYNQANGPTTYHVGQRVVATDLKLRRQFEIHGDHLLAYFDTTIALEDPLLQASLSKHQTDQMQSITATIQKEQNTIIRYPDVPVLLVNGIAGSGKTSVMMQRIAYLLYQKRTELTPDAIYLLTPNPLFQHYISTVLPDLGESNPINLTWVQFVDQLALPTEQFTPEPTTRQQLEQMATDLVDLDLQAADFQPVMVARNTLLSADALAKINTQFTHLPLGTKRMTAVQAAVNQALQRELNRLAQTETVQDELLALDQTEQKKYFHHLIDPETNRAKRQLALHYLRIKYTDTISAVANYSWLNLTHISVRLTGTGKVTRLQWLYLRIILTGYGNSKAKFVMIDEVQDYSEAQLMILNQFFKKAHFMLLGDENQAIEPGKATFKQIEVLFNTNNKKTTTCHLLTSYRSTPEITALFSRLAIGDAPVKANSVQTAGVMPSIEVVSAKDNYGHALKKHIAKLTTATGLTAIIAANTEQLAWLDQQLATTPHQVITQKSHLPSHGTILLTLALAKGLEFNSVIIPDQKQALYPDTPLARHRLYTAISRATHHVSILADQTLTPLLNLKGAF